VNEIESFRYRINDKKQVIIYDKIDAAVTISREDDTFGFSYIPYRKLFSEFKVEAQKEIKRVRKFQGLGDPSKAINVIHYSSLPWLKFSSISHARSFSVHDSVPKISFGKMTFKDQKRTLPISIHVHHGLMDGYHVGMYVQRLQNLFNKLKIMDRL
jgi:chloramphenicol O-acetyltransferase type A